MPPVLISVDDSGKRVRWSQAIPGGQIDHWVSIANDTPTGSTGLQQLPDEVCLRLVCHVLTNWMPDDALPELGETLGEMFQFYRDRGKEQEAKQLPCLSAENTRILDTKVRPQFEFAGE